MTSDRFDFGGLFIFEMANNHQGSAEHGIRIVDAVAEVAREFAVRGAVKLPTASFDDGLGTGKPDFLIDGILSKEINQKIDVSGFGGLIFRTSPDDYELSNGLRYGAGFGWPSRSRLKMFGEAFGEYYFDNTVTFSGTPNAAIGGPPASWDATSGSRSVTCRGNRTSCGGSNRAATRPIRRSSTASSTTRSARITSSPTTRSRR